MPESLDVFPLLAFGFLKNPFGTLTESEWLAVTLLPPALTPLLEDATLNAVILGRRGRGKSTSLRYLTAYWRANGAHIAYERLPGGQHRYRTATAALDQFALDEAQRLHTWESVRLFHETHAQRLIIGTHRDITYGFRWHRRRVLRITLERLASAERLAAILDRRLTMLAIDHAPRVRFTPQAVAALWKRYGDNLRAMNDALYGVFQRLDHNGGITANDLDG